MLKKLLVITFLLIPIFYLTAQEEDLRMDWEAYDPPSTLVVPEHIITSAKFPFIDVHSHHWRMAEQDLDLLMRQMDSMNMQVVVNLSGRGGELLKNMMDHVKKSGFEDRIVIFTNIELRSIDEPDWAVETIKQIEYDYKNGAKGLKIYKSQGMSNLDKAGNRIPIDDPRIDPIWAKCGELGIPILIHSADPKSFWEPHDSLNERWLELKLRPRRKRGPDNPASWETIIGEQHHIFKKQPNTTFIAAHMGWYANDLQKLGYWKAMTNIFHITKDTMLFGKCMAWSCQMKS
jgi:predicted TIM-barrel fold metal-dependent hydrolase